MKHDNHIVKENPKTYIPIHSHTLDFGFISPIGPINSSEFRMDDYRSYSGMIGKLQEYPLQTIGDVHNGNLIIVNVSPKQKPVNPIIGQSNGRMDSLIHQ